MTNTTYFHTVVRDAYSCSSSSSSLQTPETSQREIIPKESLKSKGKGFRVSSILGLKRKVVKIDTKELPRSEEIENEISPLHMIQNSEFLSPPTFHTSNFKSFSLEELKTATGNLLNEFTLRVDAPEREFKGWVSKNNLTATKPGNGIAVVVRLLDPEKFWIHEDEARYLGQLSHPNLVKLFGRCLYDARLYVFEFMPHTLGDYLFKWASHLLSWSIRMKVALGVAKGLAFLHRAQVIYREFSTSNVHLDTNYNAKLSDFGLPKDCLSGDKSRSAPGYSITGHQTAKIDVFSFGIFLLEIISGRQSSEFEEHDTTEAPTPIPDTYNSLAGEFVKERGIVKWAMPCLTDGNISDIVDHRLKSQYSLQSAQEVADLAFRCLATEATMRPDMDKAVAELEQLQDFKYAKNIEYEVKPIVFEEFSELTNIDEDLDMAAAIEEERDSFLLDGR